MKNRRRKIIYRRVLISKAFTGFKKIIPANFEILKHQRQLRND